MGSRVCTKVEASLSEACRKVCFRILVIPITIFLKHLMLFSPPEVRHVGGNERELSRENLSCLGEAARGYGHFMTRVALALLPQHILEQRLKLLEHCYQ